MASSDCDSRLSPYVLDTSVAINLVASGVGLDVIRALPRGVLLIDVAYRDLKGERGALVKVALDSWYALGAVSIVELSPAAIPTYEALVSGSAIMTLDDGESATIAHSLEIGGVAVVDERKARRLCAARYPELAIESSSGLFLHDSTLSTLGGDLVARAVFGALTKARMRVPTELLREIVNLLGPERASQCCALPSSVRTRRS